MLAFRVNIVALLILSYLLVGFSANQALAAEPVTAHSQAGRSALEQKDYDRAIASFRQHLRVYPKDYHTWDLLAIAYYFSGQPRRALRYLKFVEGNAQSSTNYLYQGLCYEALAPARFDEVDATDLVRAKQYFAITAQRYNDDEAARATVELAILEYNARNKAAARHWLTRYLQKYPRGSFAQEAAKLIESIRDNVWIGTLPGTKKPDMEQALFRYNRLSLGPVPHYWFVQGGYQYAEVAGQEPKEGGEISASDNRSVAMLANAGIGIGPIRQDETTVFAGYNYKQTWDSNSDRLGRWADSPIELDAFPFQADLLLRRHQIYGDFRREFGDRFFVGVFGRMEFARAGSTYFPSADSPIFRQTLNQGQTQLLIPWIGVVYAEHYRTLLYAYMNKQINFNSPELSNKSYDFGFSSNDPTLSIGLSQVIDLPQYDVLVDIELFRYEFIFNDPWLDYQRQGAFIGVEQDPIKNWTIAGIAGYYRDDYVFPRVRSYSCTTIDNTGEPTLTARTPLGCARTDTGTLFQLGLYWNRTQFQRVSGLLQYISNDNPEQREFNQTTKNIQLMYTWAFPSVRRVSRFVDRFADAAFTKGGR